MSTDQSTFEFGLIVHGGAWSIPDEVKEDHLHGVKVACDEGYKLLENGYSAVDVVEEVIKILEDDPTFDAGIGSHLNDVGEVEMDAIIADQNYNIGAVCAIRNVKNPISVARKVMDETEHVILVGEGASRFALKKGIEFMPTDQLLVGREKETFAFLQGKDEFSTKDPFDPKKRGFGTVGVCIKDKTGALAIGVSTGGTPHKLSGRVGDTPIWGAGGFVNRIGGTAATGFGEDLLRVLISQRVNNYMKTGMTSQKASEQAISDLSLEVDGLGGVITISPTGFGLAFNTKRMAFAVQTNNQPLYNGIEPEDLVGCVKSDIS